MDKILLKPERSDAIYQGFFADMAFEVVANPIPLYRNFLGHLGKYGANLGTLRADVLVLQDANVNCYLQELSTFVRMRLDRLEINFLKLHEVGPEAAGKIVSDAWAAVQKTDKSVKIIRHSVAVNIQTHIAGTVYDELMAQYAKTPGALGRNTQAGVVFYLPETKGNGFEGGSIVLDRVPGQKQSIILKLSLMFARQVAIRELAQQTEKHLARYLGGLGLQLEREGH